MSTISFVPKPTVASKIQEDTVNILRDALAKAEAGDAVEAIVILKHADGKWSDERSGAIDFSEAIGKLEIVKQSWIAFYLSRPDKEPA